MKTEDIKDLRELLGNIEFANAQLQQSTQKLEQFKDIEKLVPVLQSLHEIDLGKHIEKINFTKIGEEIFSGVKQSLNSQNTIITNSIQALQKKSEDLNSVVGNLQELDEISQTLRDLKSSFKSFNIKATIAGILIGVCLGVAGGYTYFVLKSDQIAKDYNERLKTAIEQSSKLENLLQNKAFIIDEYGDYKDILVIKTNFYSGKLKDGNTWIAFSKKEQK